MIKLGTTVIRASVSLSALALLCSTSACSNEVSDAKRKYEFLEQHNASYGEICDASKAWKSAAANAQSKDYQDAEIAVMGACLSADVHGRDASSTDNMDTVADNMDALPDDVSGNGLQPE